TVQVDSACVAFLVCVGFSDDVVLRKLL
ncbi:DUF3265 domain-containing protein, partial [Vibrio navarrensis]|nr:DUF3265 domain-containing protein [Vibrio navarrensis]